MFTFHLAREFKARAQAALPFPRDVIAIAAHPVSSGAFAALGAIMLGGALMFANIAHERRSLPVAAALPAASAIQAVSLVPSKPDPIAVAVKLPQAPQKSTARIDTSPVAAIPEPARIKPKHRRHRKKIKALDNDP